MLVLKKTLGWVSGFGRIRSRVGFGWIPVDSWTPESESANPENTLPENPVRIVPPVLPAISPVEVSAVLRVARRVRPGIEGMYR